MTTTTTELQNLPTITHTAMATTKLWNFTHDHPNLKGPNMTTQKHWQQLQQNCRIYPQPSTHTRQHNMNQQPPQQNHGITHTFPKVVLHKSQSHKPATAAQNHGIFTWGPPQISQLKKWLKNLIL